MKRATRKQWRMLYEATDGELELRYDWPRRLQNALLALSRMDAGWIIWVERNVPLQLSIRQQTRIVERRARALVCEGHHFSKSQWMGIVYSDTPFGEDGLKPC